MKVLVTGSAGSIGRVVVPGLAARGHDVVGLDLPDRGAELAVDCTDPAAVDSAMAGTRPEAVIHLAGIPNEASLPDALESHVVTTAALLEAMVRHGCSRIAYASSNHAVGRTPRTRLLSTDVRGRPDTFYGLGKVAAEALLQLYVDRHGLSVVSARIGSFLPRPTSRRALSTWLSHDDAVRMFDAALAAPPGHTVLYGISANTRAWWDLEPGRSIGYHPEDDAEQFATEVESAPETEDDRAEAAHVGGPYATAQLERPAFD